MYNFPRPAGHNNGGLIQFWFVPVAWVLSVPADLNSAIFGNIVLKAGKKFLTGYASFGKLSYKEPDDDSANGTLYNQGLSGKCPCDNLVLTDLFRIMKYDNRYLIIYKDVNDNFKLAGSLTEPLRFSYELKKGSSFADYNGYEYSFSCKSTKPSLFYYGTFEMDAAFYDNSFTSKIQALPESEKKNIRESIGNCIDFTFEALPGTRDVFTFRAPQEGYIKNVEAIENISGLSMEINRHVYPIWYGFEPILENAPEGEFLLRKNDTLVVKFSRTDNDLIAKALIRLFPVQKTILKKSIVRGGAGQWVVVLNYISQTISLIDTSKLSVSSYLGNGAWTNFAVLNFTIPAGTYVFSRIIYNPEENCFDLFSRNSVTRFIVDEANPANSAFYDRTGTIVNGATLFPTPLESEAISVEFIPSDEVRSAKYFIGIVSNSWTAIAEASDVSNTNNYVYGLAQALPNFRFSYLQDLDLLFVSSTDVIGLFLDMKQTLSASNPEMVAVQFNILPRYQAINPQSSFAIVGATNRYGNLGTAKYHHKTGWLFIQGDNGLMHTDPYTFRVHFSHLGSSTRFSKFCFTPGDPNDFFWAASYVTNNIQYGEIFPHEDIDGQWAGGPYPVTQLAKTNPSVNELGTRDLVYSPLNNIIIAQGMRNGNQSTGVDRIHVYDVATKAYIGYVSVGNMDARSASPYLYCGNQIAIDFYDN